MCSFKHEQNYWYRNRIDWKCVPMKNKWALFLAEPFIYEYASFPWEVSSRLLKSKFEWYRKQTLKNAPKQILVSKAIVSFLFVYWFNIDLLDLIYDFTQKFICIWILSDGHNDNQVHYLLLANYVHNTVQNNWLHSTLHHNPARYYYPHLPLEKS